MPNHLYAEQQMMKNNMNFQSQFNNFMQNPMQFLIQKRINIPQEFANDPQGAIQHLLNSGQMSQDTFNKLRDTASQMGIKV